MICWIDIDAVCEVLDRLLVVARSKRRVAFRLSRYGQD